MVDVQIRFFKDQKELLNDSPNAKFYKDFFEVAVSRQGNYRCNLLKLAEKLSVKPFTVPKLLYAIQHSGLDEMTFDVESSSESYILEVLKIPHQSHILELREKMLNETRLIEKNMISKLHSMYFAAVKVSLPSVEALMKKELALED